MVGEQGDTLLWLERIRTLGARATPARMAVLQVLQDAERALSHHDVEQTLAERGFDRVTLYRVLDWAVALGLAHKTVDADRVSRFSLATAEAAVHRGHAHFRCEACGKVFCLEDVPVLPPVLPTGFSSRAVEFCVTGQCARCDADHKDHP